jgi:putative tryptophan/tyrosine transport system substrate-binding protein
MRRRDILALIGGVVCTSSSAVRVATALMPPAHVGVVSGVDKLAAADFIAALREGLAALGYVERDGFKLDLAFADYNLERIPALVDNLERSNVNVIVTHAAATLGVVKSQRRAPVVYEFSADPITLGIAEDLAHPLENATGVSLMAVELNSKRLELLRQISPEIRRVAVVANPLHPGVEKERGYSEAAAQQLGFDTLFFPTPNRNELDRALSALDEKRPQALLVLSDGFVVENRSLIINFAMSRRLPVVSGWAVMANSGALCTYGPRLVESYRRTAYFVDRILKGAKPADLPIEQPTVFELVVNLNSAKTLGMTIPQSVLVRADRVIE